MRRSGTHLAARVALALLVVVTAWLCTGRPTAPDGAAPAVFAPMGPAAERAGHLADGHTRSVIVPDRPAPQPCAKKAITEAATSRAGVSAASAVRAPVTTAGALAAPPPRELLPPASAGPSPPVPRAALSVLRV
ncbi:hypothetical protein [Streptomyces sp. NPDC014733]|uniref:hypothetical protein n=1 Tax=Streptomyces sp. NPDC014733 TaxID=3364885 RepID=UPI0036FDD1F7